MRRRQRRADRADAFAADVGDEIARALPFAPTGAQRRAFAEVGGDLARDVPMNRLLQGDVGSGKTAVVFAAALQVARAGGQTAVMAPTELLAEQHERTLGAWSARVGLRTAVLTASTPRGVRQSLLSLLAAGQIDLVVGTHALLSEGVGFSRLGLVVIDEQHRFGVAQRVRLRDKTAGGAPHLLVATATPIPRTLALTAYGDLDVTVLDELPPGRTPVATELVTGARGRERAKKAIEKCVAAGDRAYIVCPLVEPSVEEGIDWRDATTTADELRARLPDGTVELVHGRLGADERDAAMSRFRRGDARVLVATTVIEVGVDVPEATLMVIEDADHFGLAQLHQLRGRVGRGAKPGRCILVARGKSTDDGVARTSAMVETTDGFVIAERDLELRGPGELLGAKQAGLPRLRFGDIRQHTALLLEARAAAEAVLADDPGLQRPDHAGLLDALSRRQTAYGAESG
jgi:ATP-dependent DNA helicase RecG